MKAILICIALALLVSAAKGQKTTRIDSVFYPTAFQVAEVPPKTLFAKWNEDGTTDFHGTGLWKQPAINTPEVRSLLLLVAAWDAYASKCKRDSMFIPLREFGRYWAVNDAGDSGHYRIMRPVEPTFPGFVEYLRKR